MRTLLVISGLALLTALSVLDGEGSHPVHANCGYPQMVGDINGDRNVDAADAMWILRTVAELTLPPEGPCEPVDVDCDAGVSAVDALKILRYVVELPYTQKQPCLAIGSQIL